MNEVEQTLDVLLAAEATAATHAMDAVAAVYARNTSISSIASVRGCTVREAVAVAAQHVVLLVVSPDGVPQDIRTALASRNPARDLARRRLRLHLFPLPSPDRSLDLLDEAARELRARRIILWTERSRESDQVESSVQRHEGKILGRIECRNGCPNSDPETLDILQSLLDVGSTKQNSVGVIALAEAPSPNLEITAERGEISSQVLPAASGPSDRPAASTEVTGLERRFEELSARLIADLQQALTKYEAHIVESAEHRFATRLESMATTWVGYVQSSVVDVTSRFIERTNAAFGARAEHFTQRIEACGSDTLERDKAAREAARKATTAVIREWVEPNIGLRGRWFGIGVVTAGTCLGLGMAAGALVGKALG